MLTTEEIRLEVERARLRGWTHDRGQHSLPPIWGLTEVPAGYAATTVVVAEPDGRTGFLTLVQGPNDGPLRALWTEVGGWSADEVAHRTRDHRSRYHSTVVHLARSDA